MIELKDLVLHPIQLIGVELISCNLSKNIRINEKIKNDDMNVSLKSWAEVDEKNVQLGYTYLNLNIDFDGEDKPFIIDITYRGICNIEKTVTYTEQQFGQFLEAQGLKLLWPYIKPALADFMVKMELNPLKLPTLDVLKTMEKGIFDERK